MTTGFVFYINDAVIDVVSLNRINELNIINNVAPIRKYENSLNSVTYKNYGYASFVMFASRLTGRALIPSLAVHIELLRKLYKLAGTNYEQVTKQMIRIYDTIYKNSKITISHDDKTYTAQLVNFNEIYVHSWKAIEVAYDVNRILVDTFVKTLNHLNKEINEIALELELIQ